jgi:hypothetical protein
MRFCMSVSGSAGPTYRQAGDATVQLVEMVLHESHKAGQARNDFIELIEINCVP